MGLLSCCSSRPMLLAFFFTLFSFVHAAIVISAAAESNVGDNNLTQNVAVWMQLLLSAISSCGSAVLLLHMWRAYKGDGSAAMDNPIHLKRRRFRKSTTVLCLLLSVLSLLTIITHIYAASRTAAAASGSGVDNSMAAALAAFSICHCLTSLLVVLFTLSFPRLPVSKGIHTAQVVLLPLMSAVNFSAVFLDIFDNIQVWTQIISISNGSFPEAFNVVPVNFHFQCFLLSATYLLYILRSRNSSDGSEILTEEEQLAQQGMGGLVDWEDYHDYEQGMLEAARHRGGGGGYNGGGGAGEAGGSGSSVSSSTLGASPGDYVLALAEFDSAVKKRMRDQGVRSILLTVAIIGLAALIPSIVGIVTERSNSSMAGLVSGISLATETLMSLILLLIMVSYFIRGWVKPLPLISGSDSFSRVPLHEWIVFCVYYVAVVAANGYLMSKENENGGPGSDKLGYAADVMTIFETFIQGLLHLWLLKHHHFSIVLPDAQGVLDVIRVPPEAQTLKRVVKLSAFSLFYLAAINFNRLVLDAFLPQSQVTVSLTDPVTRVVVAAGIGFRAYAVTLCLQRFINLLIMSSNESEFRRNLLQSAQEGDSIQQKQQGQGQGSTAGTPKQQMRQPLLDGSEGGAIGATAGGVGGGRSRGGPGSVSSGYTDITSGSAGNNMSGPRRVPAGSTRSDFSSSMGSSVGVGGGGGGVPSSVAAPLALTFTPGAALPVGTVGAGGTGTLMAGDGYLDSQSMRAGGGYMVPGGAGASFGVSLAGAGVLPGTGDAASFRPGESVGAGAGMGRSMRPGEEKVFRW